MGFTYRKRNINIPNIEKVFYLREYGDDKNDGTSKDSAFKTLKKSFETIRKIVSKDKTLATKCVLDIGRGTFYAEKMEDDGAFIESDNMICGCYISTNNCHIVGDGKSTKIIINYDESGFFDRRQYYFSGYNNNIVTNCEFTINAQQCSGTYTNCLFVWCNARFFNNVFFINTISISYNYCNDGYGAFVENCIFFGTESISGDYSGKPYFKNNYFFDYEPSSSEYDSSLNKVFTDNSIEAVKKNYDENDKSLPIFTNEDYKWILIEYYLFLSNLGNDFIIKDKLRTKLPKIDTGLIKKNDLNIKQYLSEESLLEDGDIICLLNIKK